MTSACNLEQHIDLSLGYPSPALFPRSELESAASLLLNDPESSGLSLQYGDELGYLPLRRALSAWLGSFYNIEPSFDRICITGEASQSIACILSTLANPEYTRYIWVSAPCYHLACRIFENAGFRNRLKAIPEDDQGIDLELLRARLAHADAQQPHLQVPSSGKVYRHIIYVVPTCANPSGITMPLARRKALVGLARHHNALILSDDVYDFLQWDLANIASPEILPEMRSPRLFDIDNATRDPQDHFGHTLSNGSFSKVLAPGLRTGWVEATPALVDQLSQAGATVSGGATSQFCAALISNLFASRDFDQHLHTRVRPSLAARYSLLQTSIDQHLLPLGVKCVRSSQAEKNIFGGYFVWIELPSGIPASQVAELCAYKMNLSVLPGHLCEVAGDEDSARYGHFIRLCFAWDLKSNLSEGVRRLASVIRALLNA